MMAVHTLLPVLALLFASVAVLLLALNTLVP